MPLFVGSDPTNVVISPSLTMSASLRRRFGSCWTFCLNPWVQAKRACRPVAGNSVLRERPEAHPADCRGVQRVVLAERATGRIVARAAVW